MEHFKCYLYGKPFQVRTDHAALQWLHNFKEPTGQVARWLEKLAAYNYEIIHRPGKRHSNADALSLYPAVSAISNKEDAWIPTLDLYDLHKAQQEDEVLSLLLQWLHNVERPPLDSIGRHGPELHYYWARFDQLRLKDGIVYIEAYTKDGPTPTVRLVTPRRFHHDIFEAAHDQPVGGHFALQ